MICIEYELRNIYSEINSTVKCNFYKHFLSSMIIISFDKLISRKHFRAILAYFNHLYFDTSISQSICFSSVL